MSKQHSFVLEDKATQLGIATFHYNIDGQRIAAPTESLAYFTALFDPPAQKAQAAYDHVAVYRESEPISYPFDRLSLLGANGEYRLFDEQRQLLASGSFSSSSSLTLPPLSFGYYDLELKTDKERYHVRLLVSPQTVFQPEMLAEKKAWGLNLQLYSLRSQRNWGIGDFGDLREVIRQSAALGAAFVGINPLHAMFPAAPEWASPYSASSRRWLNYLYLDLETLPEFKLSRAVQNWWKAAETQAQLATLRESEQVDYSAVSALKLGALKKLYAYFLSGKSAAICARRAAFADYLQQQGDALAYHALFERLDEKMRESNAQLPDESTIGWLGWGKDWQRLSKAQLKNFLKTDRTFWQFYAWLQWLAETQLAELEDYCQTVGMRLGIYGDLAVSTSRGGADIWVDRALYCVEASVGAPPDPLGPVGQNWNLPPLNPRELQNRGFEPLIRMLRANMQHFGVLRIDHVMGLFRLWLIPEGKTAADGVYVHYPFAEMMALLAIESQRNRCLIVGEDLGTVPDEVRHALDEFQIYSYFVLYFEAQGQFFPAGNQYPEHAFATIGTHDVPSLQSFWHCRDLELFAGLQILQGELLAQKYRQRVEDKQALLNTLHRDGYLPPHYEGDALTMAMHDHLNTVIHGYLAESRSRLIGVQLENLIGQEVSFNLPGTATEYPNWRKKLALPLERIFTNERMLGLLHMINDHRNKE